MAKIDEVLANPSKQIKSANGLLNKLFWTVISRAGMTTLRWNEAMRKYVLNPLYVPEQTAPRRFEARNNSLLRSLKTTRLGTVSFVGYRRCSFGNFVLRSRSGRVWIQIHYGYDRNPTKRSESHRAGYRGAKRCR